MPSKPFEQLAVTRPHRTLRAPDPYDSAALRISDSKIAMPVLSALSSTAT